MSFLRHWPRERKNARELAQTAWIVGDQAVVSLSSFASTVIVGVVDAFVLAVGEIGYDDITPMLADARAFEEAIARLDEATRDVATAAPRRVL